jgi:hypothetical protein
MQKLAKILSITLLTSATAVAAAAPVGYSINSDSASNQADSLYRIDLATGNDTRIGTVSSFGETRIDVEGLAFAPDGTLYGIDDSALTLFPLNTDNGTVQTVNEVTLKDLPFGGSNDFGMTFACDGALYVTSVTRGALYRVSLDGQTTEIGPLGSDARISALAAYGENPVRLYGLGNGLDADLNPLEPRLFEINIDTGAATPIGSLGEVGSYAEGGLAFDDAGQLWAITDRRDGQGNPQPSQVMKVDTTSGAASEIRQTAETGFESLAITVPRGCSGSSDQNALFQVQKQFVDGNQSLPTTLNIRCTSGLPLEQSITTPAGEGIEVTFTVTDFEDGALDCEIWEETSDEYYATYECFSTGDCASTQASCSFTGASAGQENLCVIRNYPESVEITVESEWIDNRDEIFSNERVTVQLICRNVVGGDGEWQHGVMTWSWDFYPDTPEQTATVQGGFSGTSECRTESTAQSSAVETVSNCDDWSAILPGGAPLTCTQVHTVFFEGIPTLSRGGLLLVSLLMLATGLVFVRRV